MRASPPFHRSTIRCQGKNEHDRESNLYRAPIADSRGKKYPPSSSRRKKSLVAARFPIDFPRPPLGSVYVLPSIIAADFVLRPPFTPRRQGFVNIINNQQQCCTYALWVCNIHYIDRTLRLHNLTRTKTVKTRWRRNRPAVSIVRRKKEAPFSGLLWHDERGQKIHKLTKHNVTFCVHLVAVVVIYHTGCGKRWRISTLAM